ncbi:MAG: ribokinase [Planctomycetes bacterium]|nr:ribokinase [Planctomycetota bacterium]
MASRGDILVVGSINMDLVVRCDRLPAPGETVLGGDLITSPGGKGANQAVAAARLGGRCRMIGRVGGDSFGEALLANLAAEGVDVAAVRPLAGVPSGVALISVAADGENAIVVAPGANSRLSPADLDAQDDAFAAASVLVLQLELPLDTVVAALQRARRHGCRVILDPAPAPVAMPAALYAVDVISPNVSEAATLLGCGGAGPEQVAAALVQRGAAAAVLKLGAAGSLVWQDDRATRVAPFPVTPVDTTAAGDAFTAALAVAVARGERLADAARFANAAGALACTRVGAQAAAPRLEEVAALMRQP